MHRTPPHQTEFARNLRVESTDAEDAHWRRLRGRQVQSAKFRRQYAVGSYIADMVCIDAQLVVECDGGQHADSTHDKTRDTWMQAHGWQVLRFWNHEVLQNMEGVLVVIAQALELRRGQHSPSPQPSPWEGEGARPGADGPGIPPSASQQEGVEIGEDPGPAPSPSQGEGWGEGESTHPCDLHERAR